jgi:hypothetical protein
MNGLDRGGSSTLSVPCSWAARAHSSPGELTPIAGPSRLGPSALASSTRSEDSEQTTPRMPTLGARSLLNDQSAPTFLPTDSEVSSATPAASARLRDLIARTSSARSEERTPVLRPRTPPSEHESDYGQGSMSVAPSFARESIRELFSRLRSESPEKSHRKGRRSSFDASEADNVPRESRRKKRMSLSDDEGHSAYTQP